MELDWRRPALRDTLRRGPGDRPALRDRIVSGALAAAIVVAFLLALLSIAPTALAPPEPSATTITFDLSPAQKAGPKQAARQPRAAARARPDRPRPKPPVPVPVPVAPGVVAITPEDFAASDIGALRGKSDGNADSAAISGPGEGPGGARLYRAEWYREPENNAITPYMPPRGAPPGSWAMIACRTVEKYHVDNCVGLGESPPGSGLSRALRQAAWQFLVRPPRLNGKPLIGAWVRIRFDFTKGKAE